MTSIDKRGIFDNANGSKFRRQKIKMKVTDHKTEMHDDNRWFCFAKGPPISIEIETEEIFRIVE